MSLVNENGIIRNTHPGNLPAGRFKLYLLSTDGRAYIKAGSLAPIRIPIASEIGGGSSRTRQIFEGTAYQSIGDYVAAAYQTSPQISAHVEGDLVQLAGGVLYYRNDLSNGDASDFSYLTGLDNLAGFVKIGDWDANTNTPTIVPSTHSGDSGDYYFVTVAGATNIDGTNSWAVGDWVYWDGGQWQKSDNSDRSTLFFLSLITGGQGIQYNPLTGQLDLGGPLGGNVELTGTGSEVFRIGAVAGNNTPSQVDMRVGGSNKTRLRLQNSSIFLQVQNGDGSSAKALAIDSLSFVFENANGNYIFQLDDSGIIVQNTSNGNIYRLFGVNQGNETDRWALLSEIDPGASLDQLEGGIGLLYNNNGRFDLGGDLGSGVIFTGDQTQVFQIGSTSGSNVPLQILLRAGSSNVNDIQILPEGIKLRATSSGGLINSLVSILDNVITLFNQGLDIGLRIDQNGVTVQNSAGTIVRRLYGNAQAGESVFEVAPYSYPTFAAWDKKWRNLIIGSYENPTNENFPTENIDYSEAKIGDILEFWYAGNTEPSFPNEETDYLPMHRDEFQANAIFQFVLVLWKISPAPLFRYYQIQILPHPTLDSLAFENPPEKGGNVKIIPSYTPIDGESISTKTKYYFRYGNDASGAGATDVSGFPSTTDNFDIPADPGFDWIQGGVWLAVTKNRTFAQSIFWGGWTQMIDPVTLEAFYPYGNAGNMQGVSQNTPSDTHFDLYPFAVPTNSGITNNLENGFYWVQSKGTGSATAEFIYEPLLGIGNWRITFQNQSNAGITAKFSGPGSVSISNASASVIGSNSSPGSININGSQVDVNNSGTGTQYSFDIAVTGGTVQLVLGWTTAKAGSGSRSGIGNVTFTQL